MEVNLSNIFSEDSAVRNAAFSVVTEILQHAPGVNVSQMKSVLGRYYDEKGGDRVHLDSAKKAIEIMTMACKLELPSMLQATRLIDWPCSNSKNQPTTPWNLGLMERFHPLLQLAWNHKQLPPSKSHSLGPGRPEIAWIHITLHWQLHISQVRKSKK